MKVAARRIFCKWLPYQLLACENEKNTVIDLDSQRGRINLFIPEMSATTFNVAYAIHIKGSFLAYIVQFCAFGSKQNINNQQVFTLFT